MPLNFIANFDLSYDQISCRECALFLSFSVSLLISSDRSQVHRSAEFFKNFACWINVLDFDNTFLGSEFLLVILLRHSFLELVRDSVLINLSVIPVFRLSIVAISGEDGTSHDVVPEIEPSQMVAPLTLANRGYCRYATWTIGVEEACHSER